MSPRVEYVDFHVTAYENRLMCGAITFDVDGDLIEKVFTFDGTERTALVFNDSAWMLHLTACQHLDDYQEMYTDLETAWRKKRQEKEWN